MRTDPFRELALVALSLIALSQSAAAQTCENPKTHKACVTPTGEQDFTFGQQILNIHFQNTCDANVTFEVVTEGPDGRHHDKYSLKPGQRQNVECNWPGQVAKYCIKSAVSRCEKDEGASRTQTDRDKNPAESNAEGRLDERACQAKAEDCKHRCGDKDHYLNDPQGFTTCQGSDDGCITKFNSCRREGKWIDPDMLHPPASASSGPAAGGGFDGVWYLAMQPNGHCMSNRASDVGMPITIKNNQRAPGAADFIYFKSIDFSLSASGELKMLEHYAGPYHGDVVYHGQISGNSGRGTYQNLADRSCRGTFTFKRK